jgi:hypothetical protein
MVVHSVFEDRIFCGSLAFPTPKTDVAFYKEMI